MVLEHIGMPQPGDCRVVFSASAEELEAAIQAEQAAENPPQTEEDLLTAAVNRAILTGFSTLYQELVEKEQLVPVTDPDFELLAVNRADGFRAGAEFYCLPPLELERYTGFTQPIQPRPIRQVSIELEVNRFVSLHCYPSSFATIYMDRRSQILPLLIHDEIQTVLNRSTTVVNGFTAFITQRNISFLLVIDSYNTYFIFDQILNSYKVVLTFRTSSCRKHSCSSNSKCSYVQRC